VLEIKDATGQSCGSFKRVQSNALNNCFTTQANFAVTFPPQATAGERALFIAASMMLDFFIF